MTAITPHLDEEWKNARNNEPSDRRAEAAVVKSAQLNAYRVAKTVAEPDRWQGKPSARVLNVKHPGDALVRLKGHQRHWPDGC